MALGQRFPSGVLRRVRNTIHKMTFIHTPPPESVVSHNIASLNMAPQLGRRDAAIDHAANLVKAKIFSLPNNDRIEVYHNILDVLEDAVNTSRKIRNSTGGSHRQSEEGILKYLLLLNDSVQAADTMLFHQQSLIGEEDSVVNSFIGVDLASRFHTADEILANSELHLHQSVCEMIELSSPRISQYREYCVKSLPRKDVKRYQLALAEFQSLFNAKYPTPQPNMQSGEF